MKKFLLIVLAAGLLFSCQKKDDTPQFQEVSFNAIQITPNSGLKSTADWECKADVPTNAWVVINGDPYYPALFNLDGKLYTQSIKLAEGTNYCVTEFVLYKEVAGEGYDPLVDIPVYGTPHVGSPYAVYVDKALGLDDNQNCVFKFDVVGFTKAELAIQVLCYLDADYDAFGFDWFQVTQIVIREQCFFGDFCMKHPFDYLGSNYGRQPGFPTTEVPFYDAPAIFSIDVFKVLNDGSEVAVYGSPFTNNKEYYNEEEKALGIKWWGVGHPVCIQYPDNLSVQGETFHVVLNILVKQYGEIVFVPFEDWTFVDDGVIDGGADGVVDFVLGSCNLDGADLVLAPWQNLPATASVEIWNPGVTHNTYWDIRFHSYTPAGSYDLPAMPPTPTAYMAGWCGDAGTTIGEGTFNANLYSSLRTFGWPAGVPFTLQQIATVNWLMNHLDDYGFDILGNDQGGQVGPIQQTIWKLLNGTYNVATPNPLAVEMYNDAKNQTSFVPLPGGWAAVLIIKANDPDKNQLVFVVVDP